MSSIPHSRSFTMLQSSTYYRPVLPAVRQAVLWLAWYILPIRLEDLIRKRIGRPIRFEIRFERKTNDSQVPRIDLLLRAAIHILCCNHILFVHILCYKPFSFTTKEFAVQFQYYCVSLPPFCKSLFRYNIYFSWNRYNENNDTYFCNIRLRVIYRSI